jgi:hypothetical protein
MSTVRIQVRRGTASEWTAANPVLAAGEMGVETNTNLFKFGNGSSTWTALSYANNSDVAIGEISQDAINTALTMGAGLTKTYNDGANTITITVDTGVVSTRAFATAAAATAQTAAEATAAADASTKASAAQAAAIAAASADASAKASATLASATAAAATYTDSAVNGVNNSLSDYLEVTERGAMNGVASLDANVKVPQAQLPLNTLTTNINTSGTVSAATVMAADVTSSGVVTANNVTISGNLTVNGTTTTVNSTNVTIDDPMIYIGDGNQSNSLDLGVVAAFNNGTYQHAGLVRDASDQGIWKLFSGVTSEPGTTVDFTTYTKDKLELGTLYADAARIGSVTNPEIQHLAGVTSPIQAQLNSKLASVADDSIGTAKLQADSVTNEKIADDAVSTLQIADVAVSTAKIADGAILTAKLADASVTSAKIPANTISQSHLNDNAVGTAEIVALAVTTEKIADAAVSTAKIANSAVTTLKIEDLAITNEKIATSAGIAQSKISGLTEALATKATIDSPTFTGAVVLPATTTIGLVDATEMGYLNGVTSNVQTQITAAGTALSAHEADTTNIHGIADTAALATKSYVDTADALKANLASPTFTGTVAGITKSMVGLGNVDNTADADKPVSTAQAASIALKAPLASPALTGTPTAPTAAAGTNTTQVATTAFVGTAVSNLVASSPAALDTLNELAAALGNDASFSTTVTNSIATKSPIASPTFTGTVTAPAITATGLVTASASGIAFTDKTQTKAGVPSLTTIGTTVSANTTLDGLGTDAAVRDSIVPLSGGVQINFETTGNAKYSVGSSISFYQSSGTGANFIGTGVTVLSTPGATLRTTNSSVTATKVAATTWLLAGDLRA